MIFDCDYVTELVEKWKLSPDPKILEVILEQSSSLIEAIVSGYDSFYRDDLIQEANLRVQYALPYFDGKIATLHTYMTTVIKNICLTYLRKQNRHNYELSIDMFETLSVNDKPTGYADILEDLIIRNRQRFPSIQTTVIDETSELICDALISGINKRLVVKKLSDLFYSDRKIAEVIYTSSVLYMRNKHHNEVCISNCADEFSIYTDINELFGKDTSDIISIIFSGMTIQFP